MTLKQYVFTCLKGVFEKKKRVRTDAARELRDIPLGENEQAIIKMSSTLTLT
jgi:hypothetical protein